MMPLTMAKAGELNFIKKIIGKEDIKRFLESLGFVTGSNVTVITKNNGNVIVNVKESRIAISQELANKIMV
jgi:ferrous iron transport protein A